jgi:hypothetical protein
MAGLFAVCGILLFADSRGSREVRARLSGFQETPSTLSTPAKGDFRAKINRDETELTYHLEYSGLVGSITQAHIHFGARGLSGGIMIWLCGTQANPGPAGTPACPGPNSGEVSRTVTAADVVGPAGQGIPANDFEKALDALRAGFAYANVHSSTFGGGEIRGQIRDEDRD